MKGKEEYDVSTILSLGKWLGIVFPKSQIIDFNFLRSREFLSFSKEKILRFLFSAINKSNGEVEPDNTKVVSPFHMNRFYIGRGNNYMLVRSVIKQRWWWSMNDSENFYKVNFLWTQWRKNKHLCILDTKKKVTNSSMNELKKQVEDEYTNESSNDQDDKSQTGESQEDYFKCKIYNRLEDNFHLSNKKALFWNMTGYYKSINKNPWDALPVTFHIDNGLDDLEYSKFLEYHRKLEDEIRRKTINKTNVLEKRQKEELKLKKMRKMTGKTHKHAKSDPSDSESSFSDISEDSASEDESSDDEFKIPK